MNEVIECLKTRRSIKNYSEKQVSPEILQQIMQAATYAPTGRGMQSPVMIAIQDRETIATLSRLNAEVMGADGDPFYGAPTLIVVLADGDRSTYLEDGSLVLGHLMIAAHSLGVDSCWIHRAKEVFANEEGKQFLKKWGLEGNYIGVGNCILGYRKEEPKPQKARKENYIINV